MNYLSKKIYRTVLFFILPFALLAIFVAGITNTQALIGSVPPLAPQALSSASYNSSVSLSWTAPS